MPGDTPRLFIRSLSLDDVPALTAILADPEVMKYSVRGVYDAPAARRFVEWCLAGYETHGMGPWALVEKSTSALIGFCGVGPERVGEVEELNLGYRLARAHWGRGLATEAARAALDHVFGDMACESVVAIIDPEHAASLRVIEKAGFRKFENITFHGRAVRLYRLALGEWAERRESRNGFGRGAAD
jgi:ribosomal-protein-alanine N-acetyltransferase